MSDLIIYTSADGQTRIDLRVEANTIWLTQLQIAELFQTSKQNVSLHAKNIFADGELSSDSVVKDSLTTASDGKNYRTQLYRLELILAIGYRIRSPRGTQFRQWATEHLKEFLVKGFVMDDERLKSAGAWDYFDELLARIRDIRASEKRFYQKVRELFALSPDYRVTEGETTLFFAEVQDKLLFAVSGHTAAELRVKQRQDLTLDFWRQHVDGMLAFNGQAVLQNAGHVSQANMQDIVLARYEDFDQARRSSEALEADAADLREIENLEKQVARRPRRKGNTGNE